MVPVGTNSILRSSLPKTTVFYMTTVFYIRNNRHCFSPSLSPSYIRSIPSPNLLKHPAPPPTSHQVRRPFWMLGCTPTKTGSDEEDEAIPLVLFLSSNKHLLHIRHPLSPSTTTTKSVDLRTVDDDVVQVAMATPSPATHTTSKPYPTSRSQNPNV